MSERVLVSLLSLIAETISVLDILPDELRNTDEFRALLAYRVVLEVASLRLSGSEKKELLEAHRAFVQLIERHLENLP